MHGSLAPLSGMDRSVLPFAFETMALTTHHPDLGCGRLFTEAGLWRQPLATFGPPAREYRLAALGLHTRTESVRLRAVTSVRLECALGHETWLLLTSLQISRQMANEKYK